MSVFGQLDLTLIESSIKENVIIVHLGLSKWDGMAWSEELDGVDGWGISEWLDKTDGADVSEEYCFDK